MTLLNLLQAGIKNYQQTAPCLGLTVLQRNLYRTNVCIAVREFNCQYTKGRPENCKDIM
jgi:hypothetical protein